jgi:hypothetical protein
MGARGRHGWPIQSVVRAAVGLLACCAVALAATACSATGSTRPGQRTFTLLPAARPAPAGWLRAALPGGRAVLAYPASMHPVTTDAGTVSAAEISRTGQYLLYLNVTPRQGTESLRNWVEFRLYHQREEETHAVRELAAQTGVRFLGGTGACVTDAYVTKIEAHHFTEIACFVRGHTSATVIVAAAPTADWASAAPVLRRAVSGYVVH